MKAIGFMVCFVAWLSLSYGMLAIGVGLVILGALLERWAS